MSNSPRFGGNKVERSPVPSPPRMLVIGSATNLVKADGFARTGQLYMDEWGHPISRSGVPYITTGLNMLMINERRLINMTEHLKIDWKASTDVQVSEWEARKRRWARKDSGNCD